MEELIKLSSFRTDFRTNKIFVLMNTRFVPRTQPNKQGEHRMYLHISSQGKQKKIPLNFYVKPEDFDLKSQKVIGSSEKQKKIKLLIDNIRSKINRIETDYYLMDRVLSIDRLVEEINNKIPRGEFLSFFAYELEKDKPTLKPATYKRHCSILNNLKKYKSEIYFTDINENFFISYKGFFMQNRSANTYYSNLKIIKKYLRRANKIGAKLSFDLNSVKVKNIRSNRVNLTPEEVEKLYNYYQSEFIFPSEKLPLGAFLFACFTSLRKTDLLRLTREQIFSGTLSFKAEKTGKNQVIKINNKAKKIVEYCPELFQKKISEQYINSTLKEIAQKNRIKKNISLHVARHTFATNYLRANGKVEQLQKLLGHSSLKETMGYVHIVDAERDESIFLLDNLF